MGLFLLRAIAAFLLAKAGYDLNYGVAASSTFDVLHLLGFALALSSLLLATGAFAVPVAIAAGLGLLGCIVASHSCYCTPILLTTGITFVVGLLGPGAYSIDAQLFGWKRLDIGRRRDE